MRCVWGLPGALPPPCALSLLLGPCGAAVRAVRAVRGNRTVQGGSIGPSGAILSDRPGLFYRALPHLYFVYPTTPAPPPTLSHPGVYFPAPSFLMNSRMSDGCALRDLTKQLYVLSALPGQLWIMVLLHVGHELLVDAQDDNHLDAAFAAAAVPSSFSSCSCCCSFPCFFFLNELR